MQRNDLLAWLDLEFTSLQDARIDRITEIAMVLTDADLNIVAEGPSIVIHVDEKLFDRINPEFRELRDASGIKEASLASEVTTEEAERQALAFLQEHAGFQSAPLCGNSIHVDRHFLRLQMPELENYLFYRCIDVSTIKELARRWAPDIYEEERKEKGEGVHRAKDDILASISELKFYRKKFFK